MISVLVYGRNDSYGYNLQKRASISLNCIAELLEEPDDEIVFVDYNTPDDLPTFTESIADVLTARARTMLRTIRVRPVHHARFASRTHLRVIESQARNAGLRRTNPKNRWILSTNTDIVFVPRDRETLSSTAAGLADGLYHTPRFELPEVMWETLDRLQPRDCIETIATWGKRFQLNEVVFGWNEAIFDGPGDFQLFLRSDAFAIDGFDERMLWGWHIDSSLARRLGLLRRQPVESLVHRVYAYHCDHNRELTPMHAPGATQNSWEDFVLGQTRPDIPEQHASWGFADAELEEIDLRRPPAALAAIASVVPPMEADHLVAGLAPETFDDLRYDPEHVAPYLANMLGAFPRDWIAGYAGCRPAMFELFLRLWESLGFRESVLVPNSIRSLSDDHRFGAVSPDEFRLRPDFFVFEVGAASDDGVPRPLGARASAIAGLTPPSAEDLARIRAVLTEFIRTTAAERESDRPRRRFVLINSRHNSSFEPLVVTRLGVAAAPYGTRVRQGYVLEGPRFIHPSAEGPSAAQWLRAQCAGSWRLGVHDAELIVDAIRHQRVDFNYSALTRVASQIARILNAASATDALNVERAQIDAFLAKLEAQRPSVRVRRSLGIALSDGVARRDGLSRIVAIEDFDDPSWREWLIRVAGVPASESWLLRSRLDWQVTQTLYALERSGTREGKTLTLVHPNDRWVMAQPAPSLAAWTGPNDTCDITEGFPGEPNYDSVVLSPRAAVAYGLEQIPAVLAGIDVPLKVGGTAVLVLDVLLGERAEDAADYACLEDGRFELLDDLTGWRLGRPFDRTLSVDTVDSLGSGGSRVEGVTGSSLTAVDYKGRIAATAVL
ncbi:MAG: hypothetical protein JO359_05020, partial [Candidatus Eremiobacteraeota bacterium]|nr:hypothetical protein [Candidatus Eremiobacteraeota bacterium]